MAQITLPDIYDENSVFKTVLTKTIAPRCATKSERMESIFAQAKSIEPAIQVSDFLPIY